MGDAENRAKIDRNETRGRVEGGGPGARCKTCRGAKNHLSIELAGVPFFSHTFKRNGVIGVLFRPVPKFILLHVCGTVSPCELRVSYSRRIFTRALKYEIREIRDESLPIRRYVLLRVRNLNTVFMSMAD